MNMDTSNVPPPDRDAIRLLLAYWLFKRRLDAAAKVDFLWPDVAELVDLFGDYQGFEDPTLPAFVLADIPQGRRRLTNNKEARRTFVEAVEELWRERGGQGRAVFPSRHQSVSAKYDGVDGPLFQLLRELFEAAGKEPLKGGTLVADVEFFKRRDRRLKASMEQLPPGVWTIEASQLEQERKRDSDPERRRQRRRERKSLT